MATPGAPSAAQPVFQPNSALPAPAEDELDEADIPGFNSTALVRRYCAAPPAVHVELMSLRVPHRWISLLKSSHGFHSA